MASARARVAQWAMPHPPTFIAPTRHASPEAALAQIRLIYDQQVRHLRESVQRFAAGDALAQRVRGCYPYVRIQVDSSARKQAPENLGLSYGFVADPGRYETTLTRPDLFADYYLTQLGLLQQNTASSSRSAPARSPFRSTFPWPRTTPSRASCRPIVVR